MHIISETCIKVQKLSEIIKFRNLHIISETFTLHIKRHIRSTPFQATQYNPFHTFLQHIWSIIHFHKQL